MIGKTDSLYKTSIHRKLSLRTYLYPGQNMTTSHSHSLTLLSTQFLVLCSLSKIHFYFSVIPGYNTTKRMKKIKVKVENPSDCEKLYQDILGDEFTLLASNFCASRFYPGLTHYVAHVSRNK